jgi:hypothetical protein
MRSRRIFAPQGWQSAPPGPKSAVPAPHPQGNVSNVGAHFAELLIESAQINENEIIRLISHCRMIPARLGAAKRSFTLLPTITGTRCLPEIGGSRPTHRQSYR